MQSVIRRIPFEIYLEITHYFGPTPEYKTSIAELGPYAPGYSERYRCLRNMALACRDFYHHVFPLLFENVMIYRRSYATPEGYDSPIRFSRFCRSVVAGDWYACALAKHVKRYVVALFDLDVPYSEQTLQVLTERLAVYWKALAYMSNVRELYLFKSAITNDLVRSMAVLPPLRVFHLEENYPVPYSLDELLLAQFSSGLQVTHVRIHDRPVSLVQDDLIPHTHPFKQQFLRYFCMQHTQILSTLWPHTIHSHFFEATSLSRPMTSLHTVNLNHLEIDGSHPHALSAALANMPAIKSLHIKKITYLTDGGAASNPWAECPKIPHLEHIHLPLPALKVLVPGSLATSIGVSLEHLSEKPVEYGRGPVFWEGYVAALKQSRRPLESMDIPMNLYTSVCLKDHFSDLLYLKVWPKHDNWYDEEDSDDVLMNSGLDKVEFLCLLIGIN